MRGSWRPLGLAAVLFVTGGVATASAQTVVVANSKPGATIELAFNLGAPGAAQADKTGKATLPVKRSGTGETDVHVWVDTCGGVTRLLLMERGLQPQPPTAECDRQEIAGWYMVRASTTLVVDLSAAESRVWVTQDTPPPSWFGPPGAVAAAGEAPAVPKGVVLFGGAGFERFEQAITLACGNVPDCSGRSFKATGQAGITYWITRFLGVELSYVKPLNIKASGSGNLFNFTHTLTVDAAHIVAKAGVPFGPARLYVSGGTTYNQATATTTETIESYPVVVDGATITMPGGTQTLTTVTQGWGWVLGGGIEAWASRKFGMYVEGGRAAYKGKPSNGGEGLFNERVMYVVLGVRMHVGG